MRKENGKWKFTKFEKMMFVITFVFIVIFPVMSVFAKSELSKVNYEVEEAKEQIKEQTKTNESLTMKINELVSLENLQDIAKELGLSYNSGNVKVIE